MTEQEHYSLRWNNHQNHILRAFDALLQTKTLVDVTLVCAETSIRAHKVVLSACSPFFQRVFSETPCKHPVIVLKDFRGWVVQAIVDFMYRGEISVPQERLQILIQAGESLQVRGLVDHPVSDHTTPTPAASPIDDDYMDANVRRSSTATPPQSYEEHAERLAATASAAAAAAANERIPATITATTSTTTTVVPRSSPAPAPSRHLLPPQHSYPERASLLSQQQQLIQQQQQQHQINNNIDHPEPCTSPMPRRKQARPRRRSGECGPHDLSSKSTTPLPIVSAPTSCSGTPSPSKSAPTEAPPAEPISAPSETDTSNPKEPAQKSAKPIESTTSPTTERSQTPESSATTTVPTSKDDEPENLEKIKTSDDERPPSSCLGEEDMMMDHDMDNDMDHDLDNDLDHDIENDLDHDLDLDNDLDDEQALHDPYDDEDDEDDTEGPENLCTKNSLDNNNSESSNNNNNRIVLSLKDIRHLNRPAGMCRPHPHSDGSTAGAPSSSAQSQQDRQDRLERLERQQQQHGGPLDFPHPAGLGHPAFMHAAAESMKREAIEGRLENESPFMDQMDLTLAAAAHHHHNMQLQNHLQNQRHHMEMEGGMHKEFTPSSPMSLPSHFNQRDGPPHPPSPLPFPGMSSALTLTPPHHSKYT